MDILEKMIMLVEELNYHTKLYDEGNPQISDKEWDEKYFRLVELEKATGVCLDDSPTYKITYRVVNELKKVKHNHPMLSLDKTKDWNGFINHFTSGKDVIGMLKLDGLTCSLRYEGGYLMSAETRGDGVIGEDILHNARVIKSIPNTIKYKGELIIDGEIICTYKDFKEFSNEYKNPRNFAAGSIRLLDSKECAKRNLTFVAWNIVKGYEEEDSLIDKFNRAKNDKFIITPWTSSFDLDAKEFLIETAEDLGYPIDGLVGRYNDIEYGESLGSTEHHSNAAYAFKFEDEEYETKLLDIEFSMGRTGVLTPVAILEPVEIDGTIVSRASLHNISVMYETLNGGAYVGETVSVVKMNMIIPQIVKAETCIPSGAKPILIPKACPICGESLEYKENDGVKTLWCTNSQCEGKLLNVIDHFVGKRGLDVKGLSKKTIEKLIDLGWINSRRDIFDLYNKRKEWTNLSGFGPKSVQNILDAIEGAKVCSFEKYVSSLGIPLVGRTVSKELGKVFCSYDDFRKGVDDGFSFYNLNGFGPELHKEIMKYDYTEADEIAKLLTFETKEETSTEVNNSLEGLIFVITGKLVNYKKRDDLKAEIEALGGKVAGSVSAKTTALINNDITSTTGKNKDAKAKGIPIITEEEFLKKYLII